MARGFEKQIALLDEAIARLKSARKSLMIRQTMQRIASSEGSRLAYSESRKAAWAKRPGKLPDMTPYQRGKYARMLRAGVSRQEALGAVLQWQ